MNKQGASQLHNKHRIQDGNEIKINSTKTGMNIYSFRLIGASQKSITKVGFQYEVEKALEMRVMN